MKEIHFMVGEEIKNDRRGWKGGGSRGRPTRERGGPWQGVRSPVPVCLSVSIFIPTVLGSSLVSVAFLSPSVHGLPGGYPPCPHPCSETSVSPSPSYLLGAGSLQDPQVIVLFGHSKFEATHGVVEAKGGILGSQGAGKHSHDGVQGSKVCMATILSSPTAVPPAPGRQPLSILEPLDLGAGHGELSEEFVRLRTSDALRKICHLQHPPQDWKGRKEDIVRGLEQEGLNSDPAEKYSVDQVYIQCPQKPSLSHLDLSSFSSQPNSPPS